MKYVSTRGSAPEAGFADVLLSGLAPDGGLYVPESWPAYGPLPSGTEEYADVAARVMACFTGDAFSEMQLRRAARRVYGRFADRAVAPVSRIAGNDHILELYHGPTLAFKDFAMQLLGAMFGDILARRGKRLTVIAATSGDTGAAAIEALAPCARIDVVVLHPEGRITDVQRRMMTCVRAPNVHNIAVRGSFDACQQIVKDLFADGDFVARTSLGGVNSINWARIAAQIAYYFTSSAAVSDGLEPVHYIVPTGNFGDVFAGYAAKRMGLNIGRLVVATNGNDILHRAMTTGAYVPSRVMQTVSPSMDIQIASNFERLLFDLEGRDGTATGKRMARFRQEKAMHLTESERVHIARDFLSCPVTEEETLAGIGKHFDASGALIDPHTAVARVAAEKLGEKGLLPGKTITLSTAHPAKFPDAVRKATGIVPDLPQAHADLFGRPEYMISLPADTGAVREAVLDRTGTA